MQEMETPVVLRGSRAMDHRRPFLKPSVFFFASVGASDHAPELARSSPVQPHRGQV